MHSSSSFHRANSGLALVEALVAVGLLTLTILASTQAMLQTNRRAAAMRTMAAARAIVQRNIDTALSVEWTSTSEPAILTVTNGLQDYDDDASLGNDPPNNVAIVTAQNDPSAAGPVLGLLRRSVTDVSTEGASLRRITIQIDYTYRSDPYTVQMTTERAIDD